MAESIDIRELNMRIEQESGFVTNLVTGMNRVIVGQRHLIDSLLIVLTPPQVSVWCVALLSFACSLMYPAIWPLAITELGKFTKKGSSLLVASIGGGALIPLLFGAMKDWVGMQNAYWICLPFYLLIMYYAYYGYKIRK